MNYSRRDESFRYQFEQPLTGSFQITRIDGNPVESHPGLLKIIDLSLHGVKFMTNVDIPPESHQVEVTLCFSLNDTPLTLTGELVWEKQRVDEYYYGVKLQTNHEIEEQLLKELKIYAKHLAGLD